LNAQIGIKIVHARPTEDFGFLLKPTIGMEILYKPVITKRKLLSRYGIGFLDFNPRLDTFPAYAIATTASASIVFPAKFAITNYKILYLNYGLDYKISIKDSVFNFYPGIDLNVGYLFYRHYEFFPQSNEGSYTDNHYYVGSGVRLGIEYLLRKRVAFFAEAKRQYNVVPIDLFSKEKRTLDPLNYNEYVLGIRYNIKKS
jgi:hypothetical protein